MPSPDGRLPRYQQIRDMLVNEIAQRVWSVGECMPTEAELARSYDASIGTIRKAIDLLVADGLVERSQGKGMFVRRPSFASSLFRFFRHSTKDGEATLPSSRIISRQLEAPPDEVRRSLHLAPDARAIRMERLRILNAKSLLLEEIWLSENRFPNFLSLAPGLLDPLLYPAYETHFGILITRAMETLSVMPGDRRINQALDLDAAAPLMVIERCAFDHDNKPVEWRRSYGEAARFRYRTEVR